VPDSINSNPFTPTLAPPSSSSSSFLPPSSSSNLRSFDRLSHEFHMIKRVGGGKFGEVYHVQHRLDGSHYAIKQLKQHCQPSNTSRLGEVFALSAVSHPNLLRYYSSWMQRQPDSAKCALHIQTQWLEGGTVASAMVKCKGGKKTASVNRYHVLELGMQMADALHYMHSAAVNMVHLDVKPENIMMTLENEEDELCKPRFVLCDFGGVVRADAHSMGDQGEGDKRYLPEEAIQHRIEDLSKIDMFALGATLFECATHVPLSLHGGWDAKFGDSELLMHNVGEQLGRLIMNLLARDPELRPSAEDVLTQLTAISFADDADDEFGPETESQDF
jgi:serine/threonine protein kinase